MSERRRGCFLQFAKAPREGFVKTRLQPSFSAREAASVARLLAERVAGALCAIPADWAACLCVDAPDDAFLRELSARHGRPISAQGEGDLGQRMARAVASALRGYRSSIVVGSDCTGFDPGYLLEATRVLERKDAVLGPALDGGYVLIGMNRLQPGLFEGPVWGGPEVLFTQRARLAALGYSWDELPPRADIDRPEDVGQLLSESSDQARAMGRLSPQACVRPEETKKPLRTA